MNRGRRERYEYTSNENIERFVKEMNKVAFKLGLKSTSFSNPHGLASKSNKSTSSDLGKLAYHLVQNPLIS
jgi:D-alanyl-D-alanine carboxypeptidase (penicillin-binding protein 5/6)